MAAGQKAPRPVLVGASYAGLRSLRLEHILRQIEPDRDNLRHERPPFWISADPPWHIDAVGGWSHHQSRFELFEKAAISAQSASIVIRRSIAFFRINANASSSVQF